MSEYGPLDVYWASSRFLGSLVNALLLNLHRGIIDLWAFVNDVSSATANLRCRGRCVRLRNEIKVLRFLRISKEGEEFSSDEIYMSTRRFLNFPHTMLGLLDLNEYSDGCTIL